MPLTLTDRHSTLLHWTPGAVLYSLRITSADRIGDYDAEDLCPDGDCLSSAASDLAWESLYWLTAVSAVHTAMMHVGMWMAGEKPSATPSSYKISLEKVIRAGLLAKEPPFPWGPLAHVIGSAVYVAAMASCGVALLPFPRAYAWLLATALGYTAYNGFTLLKHERRKKL